MNIGCEQGTISVSGMTSIGSTGIRVRSLQRITGEYDTAELGRLYKDWLKVRALQDWGQADDQRGVVEEISDQHLDLSESRKEGQTRYMWMKDRQWM